MSTVEYNRVVNVDVTISDRFPTAANFGTPVLLTQDSATDIDSDVIKTFSTLASLEAYGFAATSEVYKSAQAMLAVRRAPRTFKVAYYDDELVVSSLANILAKDSDFYVMIPVDTQDETQAAFLLELNTFALTHRKIVFFDSEETTQRDDATSELSLPALLRDTSPSRLAGFYRDTATEGVGQRYAAKAAAFVSSVDYNQRDSHYTLKFLLLEGAAPANLTGQQAQALTGFLPGKGNTSVVGGFFNTYVRTGDLNYLVEGVFTDGKFVDTTTFSDWLRATMQRNVMSVYLNNRVVPYDAEGVAMLLSAVTQTLETGLLAGALTDTRADAEGNLLPPYTVEVADIGTVATNLQAQRIAPKITFCARYAELFTMWISTANLKLPTKGA